VLQSSLVCNIKPRGFYCYTSDNTNITIVEAGMEHSESKMSSSTGQIIYSIFE